MELGVALPTSGAWATPQDIGNVARHAEALGYRSVWTFQRLLYAGPPADPFGGSPDGTWPSVYRSVLDPLTTLGYVAGITSRIRLGVAVVNALFQPPVLLAKQFATLDVLSTGRLDAGVGLGWSRAEYDAAGVSFSRRGKRLDSYLACLNHLLSSRGEVHFDDEFYKVEPAIFLPHPVQRPRPPILIGGASEATWLRAVTSGDGWVSSSGAGLDLLRRGSDRVRELAAERGRPDVRIVVRGVVKLRREGVRASRRGVLEGTLDQLSAGVETYRAAGADELFLDANFDPDLVHPGVDRQASLATLAEIMEALAPS